MSIEFTNGLVKARYNWFFDIFQDEDKALYFASARKPDGSFLWASGVDP